MLNKPTAFPICTIANTPRLPEHCIEWASVLEWPRVHKGGFLYDLNYTAWLITAHHIEDEKMDTDNPDHIGWLYDVAAARAREFNIEGVTWSLTQGVVKNIIPAIASTNAIIAASCCNEAFKIATSSAPYLDNYFMLIGTDGVYSYTFQHEKRADCPVCGQETHDMDISEEWTLERLIEMLVERQELCVHFSRTIDVFFSHTVSAKSRDPHCQRPRLYTPPSNSYIGRPQHSLRKRHVQTWRRSLSILYQTEGRLL
jgi:NEDD8-activating enzyme E1